jgi:hypothetical protein
MFKGKPIYTAAKMSVFGLSVIAALAFFMSGKNVVEDVKRSKATERVTQNPAVASETSTPAIPAIPAMPVHRPVVTQAVASDDVQIKAFDDFMRRYNAGDSAAVAEGTVALEYELTSLIRRSPTATAELGARFRDAAVKGDLSSLYALERVLSMTNAGIAEMLPGFTSQIAQRGENAPYAFQQVAQLHDFMDDKMKAEVFDAALRQMAQARDLNEYGGAQNYLMAAARDSNGVGSAERRQQAIRAITERGQRAQTDDEHFFAAYNMYQLSTPEQAAQSARQNLSRSFNAGSINAVITGLRDGTVAYDPSLMTQISTAISLGRFSEQQLAQLSTAMTSLQRAGGG